MRPGRPILPKPTYEQFASQSQRRSEPPPLVKKRHPVLAACEECRRRKIKCDAQRPDCNQCQAACSVCKYRTAPSETTSGALKRENSQLHQRIDSHERLYGLLVAATPDEATHILDRMRETSSPEVVVDDVKDSNLLLQLSLSASGSERGDSHLERRPSSCSNPGP